jgi:hypothetical protein
MKQRLLLLVTAAILLTSCHKALVQEAAQNTPQQNFEALWKGYSDYYGLFAVRGVNWDSLYRVYQPQVTDNTNNVQLYNLLSNLITPLNDIHVFLQPTTDGLPRFESSTFYRANKVQTNFSLSVLKQNYLPSMQAVNEKLHYGIMTGNVGYIHLGAFDLPMAFYRQQMDKILDSLKNTKGIIVDIRNHEGGDDKVSKFLAGRFAAEGKLFMTTRKRSGAGRNDFTAPEAWRVVKEGIFQYTKPLVLLTSRWTASAGETFAWALNTQPHVTQMGDTTAGGFSDVVMRELLNGWLYAVPVGDYRNASGESEEGKGVAPKVVVRNTAQEIAAGRDMQLEEALRRLR